MFSFFGETIMTLANRIHKTTSSLLLLMTMLVTGTMTIIILDTENVFGAEDFYSTSQVEPTIVYDPKENDHNTLEREGDDDNLSRWITQDTGNYIEENEENAGNDYQINNTKGECTIIVHREFRGRSGNDIISGVHFASGGPTDDIIIFDNCSGIAYGDGGNDELIGGHAAVELHGGDGHDKLKGSDSDDNDQLFGDDGDDTLTGEGGADYFSCGLGIDTITDFSAAEGDTKTADCEIF